MSVLTESLKPASELKSVSYAWQYIPATQYSVCEDIKNPFFCQCSCDLANFCMGVHPVHKVDESLRLI